MIYLHPRAVILALALLVYSIESVSAGAIIVHPSNNNTIDEQTVVKIFLGKRSTFDDGTEAIPIDQVAESTTREDFLANILNKSSSQFKSYWSKLLFSGKGTPPKQVSDPKKIKILVSENPQAIGYVDARVVDETVKVVLEF